MPAKDRYHDAVKRALIKDGWSITREQVLFIVADHHVWIDIEASKESQQCTVLIEVKGFEGSSQVNELMDAGRQVRRLQSRNQRGWWSNCATIPGYHRQNPPEHIERANRGYCPSAGACEVARI